MVNELTDRQRLTIKHLADEGITDPEDIAKFCLGKLSLPPNSNNTALKKRKHSILHYQSILAWCAKQ